MTARQITQFMHSRAGGNLAVILSAAALIAAWIAGAPQLPGVKALGGIAGAACGITATVAVALGMQLTNKRFNMLRSDTALPAALFMTLMLTLPPLGITAGAGIVMAVALTAASYLLFTTYGDTQPRRRIFLLFTFITALAFMSVTYLFFLPVLLLGCVQMRILNFKTVLAALLGIVTPPWIALGSGLVSVDSLEMPELSVPDLQLDNMASITMLAVAAFCIIAGVSFTSANMIKVYSYNSQTRAYNGFYTLLLLASVLLTIIDFNNISTYLPLLMAMVSYQASLFFSTRAAMPRSWVGIAMLMCVCWGAYIWYTWFV